MCMKFFVLLLFLINCLLTISSEEAIKKSLVWHTDLDIALKSSKETKKNVLMVFSGSDWCLNCIKLKKNVLSSPAFETYASEELTLLLLDFPSDKVNALPEKQSKKNEALAEKYNKEGTFPLVIILSPEGKVIGEIKSYINESPEKYIQIIKDLMVKKP